ncbi:hypothetical protein RJ640_003884, partial [Escallonia rubra]
TNSSVSMEAKPKLLVLYASQTGNSVDAAERLCREAERRGCPATVMSTHDYEARCLASEENVIFVVSTTGQGEPPDSMKAFWLYLRRRHLSHQWLRGVQYAVFGLGDSRYPQFNFVAKKLDKRLSDLGAEPIAERGLGNEQHSSGYESVLDPWMFSLWNTLYQKNLKFFPNGPLLSISDKKLIDQPKIEITFYDAVGGHSEYSNTTDLKCFEMEINRARSMPPGKFSHYKNSPDCFLQMIVNCPLTRAGCGKDVCHFEFEALSSSIKYEVGDVLEILPGQSPAAIDRFIKRCCLNPESYITVTPCNMEEYLLLFLWVQVQPREAQIGSCVNSSMVAVKLKAFVELTMDVASASPSRYFFEVMSFFASSEKEKEELQRFASPEGRDDLFKFNQRERRTVLEILEHYTSVQMPFEWLVQLVPPLKTRAYSISSSLLAFPNQVHLTVSIASWTTPSKTQRTGLCSGWLAGLDPRERVLIPAWFRKGSLPPPQPSLPLILIGPGTGCASFHGYVEERALQRSYSLTAPVLFFFGCQNEENDYLYRDFWFSHSQKDGVLSEEMGGGFYVAFSRDQQQKVYVQHKMQEQSTKILDLLSKGAAVYVAGSSKNMPSDVLSAFEEIVCNEAGIPMEDAVKWLRELGKAGKYHVEAWS